MTLYALAIMACMADPQYEAAPPAQAAGIAGYASMLVKERRPHREEDAEVKPEPEAEPKKPALPPVVTPEHANPLANGVVLPETQPEAKPAKVAPAQPDYQNGYWKTVCNDGVCRRVWVQRSVTTPRRTYTRQRWFFRSR